mgnify:FL=1
MTGQYDVWLVALSIVLGTVASFIVLAIVDRVRQRRLVRGRANARPGIAAMTGEAGESNVPRRRAGDRSAGPAHHAARVFPPSIGQSAPQRVEIENGLRIALRQQQFVLFYQPRIDVASGRITSYEALLRWRHPEYGLVLPGDFIPVAEACGLIVPIGEWVLRDVCRQACAWQSVGVSAPRIAINVSAREFLSDGFVHEVEAALSRSRLRPELLEIELAERTVMDQPERASAVLERLSRLGVQISIDDFGTGFSSLSHLRRLPLDKLKIDRSFVQALSDQSYDASIVPAIISMAHTLDLEVIAVGVETIDQLCILRDLGCDQFQGFLVSPAVPAAQAIDLIDRDPITMPGPRTRTRPIHAGRRSAAAAPTAPSSSSAP